MTMESPAGSGMKPSRSQEKRVVSERSSLLRPISWPEDSVSVLLQLASANLAP